MKLKSNGCKPLTTGLFKTRRELVKAVLKKTKGTNSQQKEAVADECGVSISVVYDILKQAKEQGK